jgi:hypothetical protein
MTARSFWSLALLAAGCGGVDHQASGGSGSATGESGADTSASGASTGGAMRPLAGSGILAAPFPSLVSATPPPSPGAVVNQSLTKLTAVEYANTVNDLLGVPPSAQSVALTADSTAGGFAVGGASSDTTADDYHDSAVAIATLVTSGASLPGLLRAANCAPPADGTGASGAACASALIGELAPLAFRHGPVDAPTLAGLNDLYTAVATTQGAGFSGGIAAVLEEILQSPYFLYHLETEEQALGMFGTPIPVTGYSMANRLSYLIWASMPDPELFAAAASVELSTPEQVAAQASRMLQDPKAKIGLRNFYQQWLTALALPTGKVGNSTQVLPDGTLAPTATANGESFATVFSPALQQAIFDSFNMQVDSAMWAGSNVLRSLLTSSTVYANEVLAPIFGVTGVTGSALQAVQVDPSKRVGILSHPLLMATYSTTSTSHPIERGRFVWDQILCQLLPAPPPGEPEFTPPPPGMGLRQDYELMTLTGRYLGDAPPASESPPGSPFPACSGCHSRMDPIGFLFEPFDTIGQYRTIDDYGVPVDLTNITLTEAADPSLNVPTASSMQLATALADSDMPIACMTANLYRYMAHRSDTVADFPVETWLDQTFTASGQNLSPVLVGLTRTDVFLERVNAP